MKSVVASTIQLEAGENNEGKVQKPGCTSGDIRTQNCYEEAYNLTKNISDMSPVCFPEVAVENAKTFRTDVYFQSLHNNFPQETKNKK